MSPDLKDRLLLLATWLIAIFLISPWGNYPVNDDWAYAQVALDLSKGVWQYHDLQAVPLLGQALYGALLIKVFGFSFTVLKGGMVAIGALGLWYTHKLAKRNGSARQASILIVLAVAFNPLYLQFSGSFLTEIFTFTCMVAGIYHLQSILHKNHRFSHYLLMIVAFLAGTLTRQTVLLIPLSFAIYALYRWRLEHWERGPARYAFLLTTGMFVLLLVVLLVHNQLYLNGHDRPAAYGYQLNVLRDAWWGNPLHALVPIGYYSMNAIMMAGLLAIPVTIHRWKKWNSSELLALGILMALSGLKIVFTLNGSFTTGDVWGADGMGPLIYSGFNSNDAVSPLVFGSVLHVLGAASFVKLIGGMRWSPFVIAFFLLTVPFSAVYLSDRYLFIAAGILILGVLDFDVHLPVGTANLAFIPAVLLIVYGLLANQLYYRTRDAEQSLIERHPEKEINMSFENNAWHRYDFSQYDPTNHTGNWQGNDVYRISICKEMDGYTPIDSVAATDMFNLRQNTVRLFRKEL